MIETEDVSQDGLVWMFQLRRGLKFHDGEPALAKDAVGTPPHCLGCLDRVAARARPEPLGQCDRTCPGESCEFAPPSEKAGKWADARAMLRCASANT
jgi:hypothetical protein